MFCASSSTSDFGTASSAFCAQRGERLLLQRGLDLALQLELEVRLDLRAELVDAAARDAERLRELGVDRRQLRLARPPSPSARTPPPCPRLPCRDSRPGNVSANVFVSPALIPATAASNSGSIRPSPRMIAKSFAWPPGNSTPSMRPREIDDHAIAGRRGARHAARSARAACAAPRSCASTSSGPTSATGRSIVTVDRSPSCTSGIDLEHRRELELVGGAPRSPWARCADSRRRAGSARGPRRRSWPARRRR